MIRRPPRSTLDRSSAASDVYKETDIQTVRNALFNSELTSIDYNEGKFILNDLFGTTIMQIPEATDEPIYDEFVAMLHCQMARLSKLELQTENSEFFASFYANLQLGT